jgi:HemY protein
MLRVLLIFLALAVLAAAGAWLADHPGRVVMDWRGHRIETSVAVAGVMVLAFAGIVAGLYRAWRWLRRSPSRLGSWSSNSRRRRGYAALTQGLVAAAAGDAKLARAQAKRAEALLDDPALTRLLAAQAAQLDGDEAGAKQHFAAMLDQPETEFLGLRGLIVQATRNGDRETALRLATRAFALRPDTPWVLSTLFDLQTANGQWREARQTLAHQTKRNLVDKGEGRHRQAALLMAEARDAEPVAALKLAEEARTLAPDLVPASALATRLAAQKGDVKKARRIAAAAWAAQPHPELAAAHAAIDANAEPAARLEAAKALVAGNPGHRESRLAVANVAIAAGRFQDARAELSAAAEGDADGRVHRLLAHLEEAEHGDTPAHRAALIKAVDSPREPRWLCGACNRPAPEWLPRCPHCGAFDRLEWRS